MIITFLFPRKSHYPEGGYKVVYEYANRLKEAGYSVNIVYPATLFPTELSFTLRIKSLLKFVYNYVFKKYKSTWFSLKKGIKERWVLSLAEKYMPLSDVIIATAWATAEHLASYIHIDKNHKFYLIQGYENWNEDEERLLKTWKAPLQKIVIAPWLQEIADSMGEKSVLIENGFDFDYFKLTRPIEQRNPYCLCMLNHNSKLKGCADGLKAIDIVKAKFPDVTLNLFGVPTMENPLPKWITYYQTPDKEQHNALYNDAAIFVAPSHVEGFGLTVGEAMLCGCAVASTDIGGFEVFCHNEETALVSPVKNPQVLANNIIRLIEDQELRIKIAKQANAYIQQFTWECAYSKLSLLLDSIKSSDKKRC